MSPCPLVGAEGRFDREYLFPRMRAGGLDLVGGAARGSTVRTQAISLWMAARPGRRLLSFEQPDAALHREEVQIEARG